MVEKITGKKLNSLVKDTSNPLVIDCFTDWCGPCKQSSPIFEQLSQKYIGKARFVKINVDEEQAVSRAFKIRVIPTFFILRGNKIKKKIEGANMSKVDQEISKELKLHYS